MFKKFKCPNCGKRQPFWKSYIKKKPIHMRCESCDVKLIIIDKFGSFLIILLIPFASMSVVDSLKLYALLGALMLGFITVFTWRVSYDEEEKNNE